MKNKLKSFTTKKLPLLLLFAGISLSSMAQKQEPDGGNHMYNAVINVTIIAALAVFVFVIASLSFNISGITKTLLKRMSENKGKAGMIIFLLLSLSSFSSRAEVDPTSFLFKPVHSDTITLVLLIAVFAILLIVTYSLSRSMAQLLQLLSGKEKVVRVKETKQMFWKNWIDKWNSAVPVENEKDVMLDHNYDGIRELDNALPPWWKYGFYVTIVFAFVYFYYYEVSGSGLSSTEAYALEMKEAAVARINAEAGNKNVLDETNVTYLSDASSVASGRTIFEQNCISCHGNEAQGLVGPNLTDDYWLHGGGINNIFKTVSGGVNGTAMIKWKGIIKPADIQLVASYVWSLQSHPVKGKEPQGEIYKPETQKQDTTKTISDTTRNKVAVR